MAVQAHSAALQHKVSVQKIALSTLQSEHDKLLAAFSRSQTRAIALEKKHAVSDSEIISLTEERIRLQAQVIDLERDAEELARSRDNFRQAAVQEGAQYVEIVRKATQLEEMAAGERKSWAKMKADMERRIEALSTDRRIKNDGTAIEVDSSLPQTGQATPAFSVAASTEQKMELPAEAEPPDPTKNLGEEIQRLRKRCAEMESALLALRDDASSMEGITNSLSLAGKGLLSRVTDVLGASGLIRED